MYNSRFASFVNNRETGAKRCDDISPVVKKLRKLRSLRKLQKKIGVVLSNQSEILQILSWNPSMPNSPNFRESDLFPLKNTDDLWLLDEALAETNNKYISHMTHILKPTGAIQPLNKRFHLLFEEQLLMQLNFEGISNKEPFKQFKNINRAIFNIQQQNGYTPVEYIKEIREAFRLFKNRVFKQISTQKTKLVIS